MQKRYLDFLNDPSCQGANRLFVLSFNDEDGRECYKQYYLPTVEIKDYNGMIDGRIINLLDDTINQPSKFRTRNWVEINDES